jgi:hypothetical protein
MRNFLDKFVEKIKTHVLYSITFFSSEKRAVYEIVSKNAVEPEGPKMKI